MTISFVILHYQNIKDTINCINDIKKLKHNEEQIIRIILVDNKSPNNTGLELEKMYKNDNMIKVILLDQNMGFSKANNIGYLEAKKQKSDIIAVINNDILFDDKDFINNLMLKKCNADILSPNIIDLNGNHQNPMKSVPYSIKKAKKNLIFETFYYISLQIYGFRRIAYNLVEKHEKKWFERYYTENQKIMDKDFVPYGAFIIFMNNWIKNEDIAFPSDSFMYVEEDWLKVYADRKKYIIRYNEKLIVKHLNGSSTINSYKDKYKLNKFRTRNKIQALKKYIDMLKIYY